MADVKQYYIGVIREFSQHNMVITIVEHEQFSIKEIINYKFYQNKKFLKEVSRFHEWAVKNKHVVLCFDDAGDINSISFIAFKSDFLLYNITCFTYNELSIIDSASRLFKHEIDAFFQSKSGCKYVNDLYLSYINSFNLDPVVNSYKVLYSRSGIYRAGEDDWCTESTYSSVDHNLYHFPAKINTSSFYLIIDPYIDSIIPRVKEKESYHDNLGSFINAVKYPIETDHTKYLEKKNIALIRCEYSKDRHIIDSYRYFTRFMIEEIRSDYLNSIQLGKHVFYPDIVIAFKNYLSERIKQKNLNYKSQYYEKLSP